MWRITEDVGETVACVTARKLREVYLAVPLSGVDDSIAALAVALRANGTAVSCLGGDPTWTVDHDTALNWAFRATADAVSHVVRQCDSLTALAYRDRATRILADVRGIAELCVAQGRRYRIGVETQPPSSSIPSNTTFGDDGEGVLRRELAAVATRIAEPLFDGFAVHHLGSWRTMPP